MDKIKKTEMGPHCGLPQKQRLAAEGACILWEMRETTTAHIYFSLLSIYIHLFLILITQDGH